LYPLSQASNAAWSGPTILLQMTITELISRKVRHP
jgi:hypothetical protein